MKYQPPTRLTALIRLRFLLWSTPLLTLSLCPAPAAEITSAAPIAKAPALTAETVQEAFVRAAERVKPSVVTIYVERAPSLPGALLPPAPDTGNDGAAPSLSPRTPHEPSGERTSLGTGMVVDSKGTILTNYHVVKDATLIRVLFNADAERPQRRLARLCGFDEESDLAVLQLTDYANLQAALVPIEFADSDAARVGEWAIAIGAPFDQAQTVTAGIVSAKIRYLEKDNRLSLQDYLQTDAAINPGNSGGPLVNLEGKVIGVNTAILSPSQFNVGIGFALPSNTARAYWPLLKAGKPIERGFLGVRYLAVDDAVARAFSIPGGIQVSSLARRGDTFLGPAHAAGLREGDIITRFNGRSVTTAHEFHRLIAESKPGTQVGLTIVRPEARDHPTRPITVVLGDWGKQWTTTPEAAPAASLSGFSRLGLKLEDTDRAILAKKPKTDSSAYATATVVTEVLPGSPANIAQIRAGSNIEKIRIADHNWQKVTSRESYLAWENSLEPREQALLMIRDKDGNVSYKALQVPPQRPS